MAIDTNWPVANLIKTVLKSYKTGPGIPWGQNLPSNPLIASEEFSKINALNKPQTPFLILKMSNKIFISLN